MNFKAEIDIMPLPALLDPQGKAVSSNMKNIGLEEINQCKNRQAYYALRRCYRHRSS